MVSFEHFSAEGGIPIYRQMILYIKRGLAAGFISVGDEMPSRRVLSAMLGVNPNTVQKAYHLLETEGLIASAQGAKSYVTATREQIASIRRELLERQLYEAITAMKQLGMSRDEAARTVHELWDAENKEETP